ncbi:RNA polymerase II transcription factor SIII subunit A-domain-containing protein [Chlamydoabsidia padenii]|nr:RNA polymerase II transcription factor SIII subunit A-domain-containing protein [Chlamydoabsidia padenii]
MPTQVKSLVLISQEILTKNIDGLSHVGSVPYSLLRPSLKKATPQQLYLIERLNPHLTPESNELWLRHMSSFKDLLDAYHSGDHQDSRQWRGLYLKRYQENEKRKKIISEKVKSQYSKIQNEKAARSIKVLKGVVRGRTHDTRRCSGTSNNGSSRLFLETKKAASKTNAIYRSHIQKPHQHSPTMHSLSPTSIMHISKPPSKLVKSYRSNQARYRSPTLSTPTYPMVIPPSSLDNHTSTCGNQQKTSLSSNPASPPSNPNIRTKKPVALVNYNIFEELR